MSAWEYCRISEHEWTKDQRGGPLIETLVSVAYYVPQQELFKFAAPGVSFGHLLAVLGRREWEAISMHHAIELSGTVVGGQISSANEMHPSGESGWKYRGMIRTAYLKRVVQVGRTINDAFS